MKKLLKSEICGSVNSKICAEKVEKVKFCGNKIIFKCVNSTVRPIFNEKVTEK